MKVKKNVVSWPANHVSFRKDVCLTRPPFWFLKKTRKVVSQVRALTTPSGPWCLTFALVNLRNLVFFHRNLILHTLDITGSEHFM